MPLCLVLTVPRARTVRCVHAAARNYVASLKNDGALLLIAADDTGSLRVRPKCLMHVD
jgi:hypothetical protein